MARFTAEVAERAVYKALRRARVNVVVRETDAAVEERVADGKGVDDREWGGDDDETEARGGATKSPPLDRRWSRRSSLGITPILNSYADTAVPSSSRAPT